MPSFVEAKYTPVYYKKRQKHHEYLFEIFKRLGRDNGGKRGNNPRKNVFEAH